jgi:hypothetical protein
LSIVKTIVAFVVSLINLIASYFPTALPVGLAEFNQWANSILAMSKAPNNDTTQGALAVMVLHLDATTDRKPKRYFVSAINKGAASEVAAAVFQGIKAKQQAAMKAAQESNTVQQAATSGSQTTQTPS